MRAYGCCHPAGPAGSFLPWGRYSHSEEALPSLAGWFLPSGRISFPGQTGYAAFRSICYGQSGPVHSVRRTTPSVAARPDRTGCWIPDPHWFTDNHKTVCMLSLKHSDRDNYRKHVQMVFHIFLSKSLSIFSFQRVTTSAARPDLYQSKKSETTVINNHICPDILTTVLTTNLCSF